MQVRNPLANLRSVMRTRAKLAAGALGLHDGRPRRRADGDGAASRTRQVTTNAYTIGAPSAAVGAVAASPSSVGESALTNFAVTFDLPVALSGPGHDSVTVTPSTALASVPANVDIVGGSCIQAGTAGAGGAGSATTYCGENRVVEPLQPQSRPESGGGLYCRSSLAHGHACTSTYPRRRTPRPPLPTPSQLPSPAHNFPPLRSSSVPTRPTRSRMYPWPV